MENDRTLPHHLAERLFATDHEQWKAEDDLYNLLESAGIGESWGDWGRDSYDGSLELYGVPPEFRLSDEAKLKMAASGFSIVFLNHSDAGQTTYHFRDGNLVTEGHSMTAGHRAQPAEDSEMKRLRRRIKELESAAPLPPPQARTPLKEILETLNFAKEVIDDQVERFHKECRCQLCESLPEFLQRAIEVLGAEGALDGIYEYNQHQRSFVLAEINQTALLAGIASPRWNALEKQLAKEIERLRAESAPQEAPQQVVCHKCGESFIFKRDGDRLLTIVRGHNCGNQEALASQQETLNILARHGIKAAPQEAGTPTVVFSEWREQDLWWNINGEWVSDKDIRSWCYHNLPDTWKYVDTLRKYQSDAYARRAERGVSLEETKK